MYSVVMLYLLKLKIHPERLPKQHTSWTEYTNRSQTNILDSK